MRQLINRTVLLVFILTGCSKYVYHKPDIPVVNKWSVSDTNLSHTDEKNIPYLAWWQSFNDPTLNKLITLGLKYNNNLNMSRGHVEAAEGELKKVRFQWIPTLDALIGYSRDPATGFPGFLGVIIPNYLINIAHQIKEQKVAKYSLAQIKAEDDSVKLMLISEIAASYFTYLAEIDRKRFYKTLANDIRHLANISNKAYIGGLISFIDEQELYSQAKIVRGEQEVSQKNIVATRNTLRYLVNLNPGDLKSVKNFSDITHNHLIPGSLPLTVLENRPDMQMAENRLRASNAGIGLAASNLLPSIKLNLIDGEVAGNSSYNWPNQNIYFNNQLIDIPLLRMSVLGDIAKARGLDKVSYFHYVDTLRKALKDTTNALAANDRLTKRLQHTQSAQRNLRKAYELNRHLYKQGIQNYADMLKAKINLDRINIKLNEDKLQQLLTIVILYQELAGGYKAVADKD